MATNFLTTICNAFSWMKIYKYWIRFHWYLFPRVKLTLFQHWFRYWLGDGHATSHYTNQWWLVYWRIYASLGLNELKWLVLFLKILSFPNDLICGLGYFTSCLGWIIDDILVPVHDTLMMRIDTATFTLLLKITLGVCHASSQCTTAELCQLKNTRAVSTTSSSISKRSIYPSSCARVCSQNSECVATTYDPITENCVLHGDEAAGAADGTPCMALSPHVGSAFSMNKLPGTPCPKVSHTK